MKKILYIFAMLAVLPIISCTREVVPEEPAIPDNRYEGQEITVYFGVQMPEMTATKAMGENPTISNLHVAVFGSSGYLKEYKLAEPVNDYVSAEGVANAQGYKVQLSITTSKIRVHLIANGPDVLDFDYESVVMSKLTSENKQDAYWQRILLNHGIYADTDAAGYYDTPPVLTLDPDFDLDDDGTTHKMALIPLIRNFAKLTVIADDPAESHFTISSFAVVNVPNKGSVAPYNTSTGDFMMNYHTYPTLNDLAAVYPGNMPSATTIDKSYPTETDFANRTNGVVAAGGALYMYERPVPVSDATVLIVYGTYTDPKTGDSYPGYYKVDLMKDGQYLPILRNFRYQINIQKVNRKGKSTVAGAINGAGSADISADISTASQVNLSDGKSGISVEYTEKTLPIGGTYTLGVTFTSDVSTGTVDNSLITYQLLAAEANGAVIASENDISWNSTTGTLTYTTTDVHPTLTKSQKIRVIGTSSTSRLYRDITIRLLPQQTMTVSCIPQIEASEGTAQVVAVSIPKDLPSSIFPLQFKVEVEAKSLTPNADDLPVSAGETIVPNQTGRSFQFIKTVSYTDYTAGYQGNVSIFYCSFKSIIPASDSNIYVANQYFATGSTSFSTFELRKFSSLTFSTSSAVNEDDPVVFTFVMDAEHETGSKYIPQTVQINLTGLVPNYDNPGADQTGSIQNVSGNQYVYTVPAGSLGTGTQRLYLLSTGETKHYKVELKAQYYKDNELVNSMFQFSDPTFGTVFYGNGWPTTFSFTIPNTYTIPSGGIDIELNLTNLVPDDNNITESGGKYYYHVTSRGTKTLNFKTADNRTAAVSVELIHDDFDEFVGTKSDRSYVSIAAQKIQFTGNRAENYYNNTVRCYSDSGYSTQVGSFTGTRTGWMSYTYYNGAFTFTGVVDATQTIYMRYQTNYYNYTASATALNMYNGTSCSVTRSNR